MKRTILEAAALIMVGGVIGITLIMSLMGDFVAVYTDEAGNMHATYKNEIYDLKPLREDGN